MLNVYTNGQLCWGNIPRPKRLDIASIPAFEHVVFDSWSTHTNPGQELTVIGKGGLVRLWDELATHKAKRFPVARLKPFRPEAVRHGQQRSRSADTEPMTIGQLLAGWART